MDFAFVPNLHVSRGREGERERYLRRVSEGEIFEQRDMVIVVFF